MPESLREASFALGVSRWRTVLGVILPASFGGILTGADARGRARRGRDGAAALHLRRSRRRQVSWDPTQPLQSIPLTIFQYLEQPDPAVHAQAWAAALVLMTFVLVVSVLSKAVLARSRRKLAR